MVTVYSPVVEPYLKSTVIDEYRASQCGVILNNDCCAANAPVGSLQLQRDLPAPTRLKAVRLKMAQGRQSCNLKKSFVITSVLRQKINFRPFTDKPMPGF
jgi:hypothetical protein